MQLRRRPLQIVQATWSGQPRARFVWLWCRNIIRGSKGSLMKIVEPQFQRAVG